MWYHGEVTISFVAYALSRVGVLVNSSQQAKLKKYIPLMSLRWNLKGRSGWS